MRGMEEGKDYQSTDSVISFICTFVDNCTGYTEDWKLMILDNMYSELLVEIHRRRWSNPQKSRK